MMNTIAENKIVEKYPNYEKLAQYLNTLENPQRILRTFVVLCEMLRNDEKDNEKQMKRAAPYRGGSFESKFPQVKTKFHQVES